jgi:hypothetical protein
VPAHCIKHVNTLKPQLNTQSGSCDAPPAQAVAHEVPVVAQPDTHVGKSATETWLAELKRDFVDSSAIATMKKSIMARVMIPTEAVRFPMIDFLLGCILLGYRKLGWLR